MSSQLHSTPKAAKAHCDRYTTTQYHSCETFMALCLRRSRSGGVGVLSAITSISLSVCSHLSLSLSGGVGALSAITAISLCV